MKQKKSKKLLNRYVKLCLGLSLLIVFNSCVKENVIEENSTNDDFPFNVEVIPKSEFVVNESVMATLESIVIPNNSLSRTEEDTEIDFAVNTDFAKYVETNDGDVHSYTFLISREEEIDNEYENLVLTLQPDGSYDAELVKYTFSEDSFEIQSGPIDIDSSDYLNRTSFSYVCTTTIYVIYQVNDNGDEQVQYVEGETTCQINYYNNPTIDAGGSGGGGGTSTGGDVWTGGGGGSGGGTITSPTSPCNARGDFMITDSDGCSSVPSLECLKITDIMNNPNVDVKGILQSLATVANTNSEIAITIDNKTPTPDTNVVDAPQGAGGVIFNTNPTDPYIVIAHTHDAFGVDPDGDGIGSGTYSVFSFDDLKNLAKTLHNSKIDGTFVAFLITAKGTRYAMTIKDTSKFLDLFYMHNNTLPTTANDISKWTISKENLEPLYKDYYDTDNENRKIKETDTNNENVLKHFLKFLEDGDAGLSLFEANESFDSFQPVTLDTMGNVDRNLNPCNTQN